MKLSNSLNYLSKAEQLIPACSQTFSKGPNYFPKGAYPVYIERGEGCHITDVDKNNYIDYILALGPITLGYNYPVVNAAIMRQLKKGIIFSLPHPLEIELAELLSYIIPCTEMSRFSKTGSEVTSAAIKLARAYTGRDHIACCGYHGWHDWYTITTDMPRGIPEEYRQFIHQFDYNDLPLLDNMFEGWDFAAVIMEPVMFTPPLPGYLQAVKDLCHKNGALLIFDEMVTGFRFAIGGAQEYFNVVPDLATFGKGMANGMPLAALVGKREIMKELENVFFSTTFGGETLSLAACIATIMEMIEKDVFGHIRQMGSKMQTGIEGIEGLTTQGYACRPLLMLELESDRWKADLSNTETVVRSLLMQEMAKRGFLIPSGNLNFCYCHQAQDIRDTLDAFEESMGLIREGKVQLEGEVIKPIFRRL